ncbi:MAG: HlyD family secretion protein [Phycisphaerales bacterium]
MTKWTTILLSICGLAVGAWAVVSSRVEPPVLQLSRQPSVNPFARGIASLGIVEPLGRAAAIAAPGPGLVTSVLVEVGQGVRKGDPLMTLDSRELQAQLELAKAAVPIAEAEIARWHALPRVEDIPPLEALVAAARAELDERQIQLRINEEANARGAATERDVATRRALAASAAASLVKAEADLARLRAGGWAPDLALAQATLDQRRAEVRSLEVLIERLTVRAPADGVVLRRNVEPGEYAGADQTIPLMLIGDLSALAVRAQVDEEDILLLGQTPLGLPAMGRTRGSVVRELPLKLLRVEPYARGKQSLSGANTERVDTRVIDVVLALDLKPGVALYPGQALDVFIDTGPAASDTSPKDPAGSDVNPR